MKNQALQAIASEIERNREAIKRRTARTLQPEKKRDCQQPLLTG